MEESYMKTIIGIFQGKQKANNKFLLETLYNNGPLTAWELTREYTKKQISGGGRHSLHAIFNRRLRGLEKKGYLNRAERKWLLQFKGIIAVLLIQPNPKPWSEKWTKIFENYVTPIQKSVKRYAITEDGKEIFDVTHFAEHSPTDLRKFENWILLSNWIKKKMEEGFINFDVITNETLLLWILSEFLDAPAEKN